MPGGQTSVSAGPRKGCFIGVLALDVFAVATSYGFVLSRLPWDAGPPGGARANKLPVRFLFDAEQLRVAKEDIDSLALGVTRE
jgi:hypothetical protein